MRRSEIAVESKIKVQDGFEKFCTNGPGSSIERSSQQLRVQRVARVF